MLSLLDIGRRREKRHYLFIDLDLWIWGPRMEPRITKDFHYIDSIKRVKEVDAKNNGKKSMEPQRFALI